MKIETIDHISEIIQTGKTPPTKRNDYFNGIIDWFTPSDFKNKYLINSDRKITQLAINDKKGVLYPADSVLITCIGEIGKVGIIKKDSSSNQQITAIKTKKHVCADYLYYWIKDNQKIFEKFSNNAVVPILNNMQLKKIKIPIPLLQEQKYIVDILDRADDLRQKRKQAIEHLDEFLKVTFIDIFGDPGINKDWEMIEIRKVLLNNLYNENPEKFPDKIYNYIDISSIDNKIKKIISINKILGSNAPSRARQIVNYGDILISTVRPNLNAVAIIEKYYDNLIASTGFCILRINKKIIDNNYLFFILKSYEFIEIMTKLSKGASYPAISDNDIKNYKIFLPPINLQKIFSNIVETINKIKSQMLVSQQELDSLFNSLMQRCFK